jgi:hypothetical protein
MCVHFVRILPDHHLTLADVYWVRRKRLRPVYPEEMLMVAMLPVGVGATGVLLDPPPQPHEPTATTIIQQREMRIAWLSPLRKEMPK